jgi:hypothetical protein
MFLKLPLFLSVDPGIRMDRQAAQASSRKCGDRSTVSLIKKMTAAFLSASSVCDPEHGAQSDGQAAFQIR